MASENEIQIVVRAVDEATKTLERIEGKIDQSNKSIAKSNERLGMSFQDTTNTLLALGNAAATVDRVMSSYQNLQIRLENASIRVENAQERVADVQLRLTRLVRDGKTGTDEYIDAQTELERAQRNLTVSQNNLARANNQVIGTYINIGLQITTLVASLPTLIGSISKLGDVAVAANVKLEAMAGTLSGAAGIIGLLFAAAYAGSKYTDSLIQQGKITEDEFVRMQRQAGSMVTETELRKEYNRVKQKGTELQIIQNQVIDSSIIKMDSFRQAIAGATEEENRLQMSIARTNSLSGSKGPIGTGKGIYDTSSGKRLSKNQAAGLISSRARKVGDALIRPNGQVIEFSPKDNILAMEDMGGMRGGGVVITGNNIYGTSPDDIANAILDRLRRKITI